MSQSTRILIIEDDKGIREILEAALKRAEYSCDLAGTAAEGYTLARANNPDVILLDLGLPDYDGVDLIAKIRREQDTPILVISAREQEKDKIEALEFIIKSETGYTGIPLKDLSLKSNNLIACIARKRQIIIPGGDDCLEVGDSVIVITMEKHIEDIEDILA